MEENLSVRQYISKRTKYLRSKKGLSQDKLSELSGLDSKHISRIETNAPNLELESVERIIDALGETDATFFNWKFPTSSEEIRELNDSLEKLPDEDQAEIANALTLLVKKINKRFDS
ncbi:helix-turn-helix domain-containing protein [Tetragenococcus koreensis]|uniref:helix-turn-helix domain-containing protein n=1 Tax=Tetragenococcus koreensis TaxID=290335 RepID=UPI000F516AA8|nr:helix-turn-helix domain-containing protein [Tetragenococcus koreensis]MDN6626649.1 helix-turn-helix domain-containing protein [Pisciglobus halotolerans]AYW46506.1 hypothetical protein C7K43_11570 [Tetragenococcus koreensis]MCF1585334.1 helix-turn-helix domain-containing protein [Tetragenococcus koreensis]MCF1619762.1 helix-turn-helix domain-containing protein [Tetragenococcus koreensis]MCF1629613.1 helix-turn-helix domain-containing protein [Tetragenococcus koreensis]